MTVPSDRKEARGWRQILNDIYGDSLDTPLLVELRAALLVAERERERYRDQFAWIAREARGDCDRGRILHACNVALDALASVSPEGEAP